MSEELPSVSISRELTTNIVAAYVRQNQIASDQLATLISTVHQALSRLGKPAAETETERTPPCRSADLFPRLRRKSSACAHDEGSTTGTWRAAYHDKVGVKPMEPDGHGNRCEVPIALAMDCPQMGLVTLATKLAVDFRPSGNSAPI
jgi:hypothetical protein